MKWSKFPTRTIIHIYPSVAFKLLCCWALIDSGSSLSSYFVIDTCGSLIALEQFCKISISKIFRTTLVGYAYNIDKLKFQVFPQVSIIHQVNWTCDTYMSTLARAERNMQNWWSYYNDPSNLFFILQSILQPPINNNWR